MICKYFNNGQQCPWQNRCHFAHGDKELRHPYDPLPNSNISNSPNAYTLINQLGMALQGYEPTPMPISSDYNQKMLENLQKTTTAAKLAADGVRGEVLAETMA